MSYIFLFSVLRHQSQDLEVISMEWKMRLLVQNSAVIDAVYMSKIGSCAAPKLPSIKIEDGEK
jgi:hypothetical protein